MAGFDPTKGWSKFPFKGMYSGGAIGVFSEFHLRQAAELDALKLFFLLVAFRDNSTNLANIGYDKIETYTEIKRSRIKAGLSLLAAMPLVHIERLPSLSNPNGIFNAYRIVGIQPYKHMGTQGRSMVEIAADD